MMTNSIWYFLVLLLLLLLQQEGSLVDCLKEGIRNDGPIHSRLVRRERTSDNSNRHYQPSDETDLTKGKKKNTVHVYILAGQSNMEGHGEINKTDDKTDGHHGQLKGTLLYQMRQDPRTKEEFTQVLWNATTDSWRSLPNVKIWFQEAGYEAGVNGTNNIPGINGQDYSAGDLTVGYGEGGTKRGTYFGPELGFGFHIELPPTADSDGDKILLIKTAWGVANTFLFFFPLIQGKDLAQDFRPPSSAATWDPYCRLPECDPFEVGHFYNVMLQDVQKLLQPGVLGEIYPDLMDMTPDIAGFGWFQGWNDGTRTKRRKKERETRDSQ
eukprot:scaffold6613_cov75-Cylindrotheca_fusiformis.AAC.1